jgi:RNA polymerase sigma-70 factor, ECF subfamily
MTVTLEERELPGPVPAEVPLDEAIACFSRVRPRLLGIATRILGDWSEAEDLVQDVWVRWQGCDREIVRNPEAFLVTATTRLALNAVQSVRVRSRSSFDERIPAMHSRTDDPAADLEMTEEVEHGVLLLCERLAPTERAAFVLRAAFDYPHRRIAELLGVSETNARQLVSRAGRRIVCDRKLPVERGLHEDLTRALLEAARHGSITALEDLLAAGARTSSVPGAQRAGAPFPDQLAA